MTLQERYHKEIRPEIVKEFKLVNVNMAPRIIKVVINVGAGEAVVNKNAIENIQKQLNLIAGQKPVITKARKSISAFKIRKGLAIGVKVTLRGERMFSFLEKMINVVIPRLRDFRGVKESTVDGYGNLNLGFTEQTLFPEIEFDMIDKLRGLQVVVSTTAKNHERGKKLFELMGIPFKK